MRQLPELQSHKKLGARMWAMAQAVRARYFGKDMPDDAKATVRHLEAMSNEHYRKSFMLPVHDRFIARKW